jgi:hypothetical protein
MVLAHIFTCWLLPYMIAFNGVRIPDYGYIVEAIYMIDLASRSVLVLLRLFVLKYHRETVDDESRARTRSWHGEDEENGRELSTNYFRLRRFFDLELGPSFISDFLAIVSFCFVHPLRTLFPR